VVGQFNAHANALHDGASAFFVCAPASLFERSTPLEGDLPDLPFFYFKIKFDVGHCCYPFGCQEKGPLTIHKIPGLSPVIFMRLLWL